MTLNSGGPAPALGPIALHSFELVLAAPRTVSSQQTAVRLALDTFTVTVELTPAEVGVFQALNAASHWGSATFTFNAGSGLTSVSTGIIRAASLTYDAARTSEQLHTATIVFAPMALTVTPTTGSPTTWSFDLNTGSGTLDESRLAFVAGGTIAGASAARDIAVTVTNVAPAVGGGGGGPGRAALTAVAVQGLQPGVTTAQWMLRMGRQTPWAHDPTNMPLTLILADGNLTNTRLELSCQLIPVRVAVSAKNGTLSQDVSFVAGVLRTTAFDGLGTATSAAWSYADNAATTTCASAP